MALVNINKDFNPNINFWEQNPQLILMTPFNGLYSIDGGNAMSSKLMWSVFFVCDPDESVNKFFKFGREKIEEMLEETYFQEDVPDWKDERYEKCLKAYPDMCLTSIQQSFMMKKNSLNKRAAFLDATDYDLSTMKDLDMAHSKTAKIMDEYKKLEDEFFAEQAKARVKGGRNQSKSEQHIV